MKGIFFHYTWPVASCLDRRVDAIATRIDRSLRKLRPIEIAVLSIASTILSIYLKNKICKIDWQRVFLKWYRNRPAIVEKMEKARANFIPEVEKSLLGDFKGPVYNELPSQGLSRETIFNRWMSSSKQPEWQQGKVSGAVYNLRPDIKEIIMEAISHSLYSNPLHQKLFHIERRSEAETIRMSCHLFHGGPETCGVMTSGGTESLILVVKAARDRAIKEFGIDLPEIIIPATAHAAFLKASDLTGVEIIEAPVDPKTFKVDVEAVKRFITNNTVLIVGSCPQYPSGAIDPIEDLSNLVIDPEYKGRINLHVDACLGSFLLPFMQEAGYPLPPFDFSLPGVTSLSADTHKYGQGLKGGSVLLFRNQDVRKYSYFVYTRWPGGLYGTPTIAGSRPGFIIAATWAVMLHLGREGYIKLTKEIMQGARQLKEYLQQVPEIKIMGDPQLSVIAITSKDPKALNIYDVMDELHRKGWELNPIQRPAGFHFCVTQVNVSRVGFAAEFSQDIKDAIQTVQSNPNKKSGEGGTARIYGGLAEIPELYAEEFLIEYYNIVSQTEKRKA